MDNLKQINDAWRDEIEKYLPQLSVMSFCGPELTIRWLMEQVEIKPEPAALAERLKSIAASDLSEEDKCEARLRSMFPNLGPMIRKETT